MGQERWEGLSLTLLSSPGVGWGVGDGAVRMHVPFADQKAGSERCSELPKDMHGVGGCARTQSPAVPGAACGSPSRTS